MCVCLGVNFYFFPNYYYFVHWVQFEFSALEPDGGGGGASFLGGIRSFILSSPLASSKLAILCVGEKPANAGIFFKKQRS